MTVQTVKLGGRKFVILAEKEYRRLQQEAEEIEAQNRGDIAESRRRMKERGRPYIELRKKLGLG